MSVFSESDLLAISKAFENVGKFMSETELAEILKKCNIPIMEHSNADTSYRLFESLKKKQSQDRHRRSVLAFLRVAMNPDRYEGALELYKIRRQKLNRALEPCRLEIGADGSLNSLKSASEVTVEQVERGKTLAQLAAIPKTDLLAISEVFGHPKDGLTESELISAFEICGFPFESSSTSRTETIYQALKDHRGLRGDRGSVLGFLRVSMNPDRYKDNPDRFVRLRAQLNETLLLYGLQVEEDGSLSKTQGLEEKQMLRYLLSVMFRLIGLGWLMD